MNKALKNRLMKIRKNKIEYITAGHIQIKNVNVGTNLTNLLNDLTEAVIVLSNQVERLKIDIDNLEKEEPVKWTEVETITMKTEEE